MYKRVINVLSNYNFEIYVNGFVSRGWYTIAHFFRWSGAGLFFSMFISWLGFLLKLLLSQYMFRELHRYGFSQKKIEWKQTIKITSFFKMTFKAAKLCSQILYNLVEYYWIISAALNNVSKILMQTPTAPFYSILTLSFVIEVKSVLHWWNVL